MGSALSPILADFVMEDLIDKMFINEKRAALFIRYVDDILTCITDEHHEKILEALNNVDDRLKFDDEVEKQEEKTINYLDFTLINKPYDLKFKWYQKHIASGRFLNYHSHHTKSVIWHTAVEYVVTMINNSSPEFHEEIINTARNRLTINSYPPAYIERVITAALEKIAEKLPALINTQMITQLKLTPQD